MVPVGAPGLAPVETAGFFEPTAWGFFKVDALEGADFNGFEALEVEDLDVEDLEVVNLEVDVDLRGARSLDVVPIAIRLLG